MPSMDYHEVLLKMGYRDAVTKPTQKATTMFGKLSEQIEGYSKTLDFWDGVLATQLSQTFEDLAISAGKTANAYEQSWKSLNYTFQLVGYSHKDLQSAISEVTDQINIGAGASRDYFQAMGNYGVNNLDLLKESFIDLYGRAGLTGKSFDTATKSMENLVNSGRMMPRILEKVGLSLTEMSRMFNVSSDDLKKAFKEMTPEERLQVLDSAMGDTSAGIDMMNNSLEGTEQLLKRNMDGAKIAFGQAILPALKSANVVLGAGAEALKDLMNFPGFNILASGVFTYSTALIGFVGILKMVTYYHKLLVDIKKIESTLDMKAVTTILQSTKAMRDYASAFISANKEAILLCLTILALTYALDKLFNLGIFEGISKTIHGGIAPAEEFYSQGGKSAIEGTNPAYATQSLPEYSNSSYPSNTTNIYVQEGAIPVDARNKTSKEARQDIILGLNSLNESEKINFNRKVKSDEQNPDQQPRGAI